MRVFLCTLLAVVATSIAGTGCRRNNPAVADVTSSSDSLMQSTVPFNADTAFAMVKAQLDMGPRNPGSEGHRKCEDWIIAKLREYGADSVISQKDEVEIYTGERKPLHNIIGQFNKQAPLRILLFAHYDTRPWADNEEDESKHNQPIPGANDGGSGVAVLLEIARNLKAMNPAIGVDLFFTDLEDSGQSGALDNDEHTWALGAQHFAHNLPYTHQEIPVYGIGVDMVGGIGATFHRDYYSEQFAPALNAKVWGMAARSGFQNQFINDQDGAIVDDFLYINQAGIPSINIIEAHNKETGTFPATWHTLNDNLDHIDPQSLKAVGQTLINLISTEKL